MLENVLDKNAIFCLWPDSRMLMRIGFRLRRRGRRAPGPVPGVLLLTSALGFAMLGGCSSLRPKPQAEYVYVTAKETFLRDRLAAVTPAELRRVASRYLAPANLTTVMVGDAGEAAEALSRLVPVRVKTPRRAKGS